MAWCLGIAFSYNEEDMMAFLLSMIITFGGAFLFLMIGRQSENTLSRHDAYVVVTATWMIFSFFLTYVTPPLLLFAFFPVF